MLACAARLGRSAWGCSFSKLVMLDVLLTGLSILLEFASLVALRIREPLFAAALPRARRIGGRHRDGHSAGRCCPHGGAQPGRTGRALSTRSNSGAY